MQHIFKAIAELRKVKTENQDIKVERDSAIRRLREAVRNYTNVNSYFLTAEEIKREQEIFWRFRNRNNPLYKNPMFRRAKNGEIININGGYYIKTVRKALEEGSSSFLKTKEDYLEYDGEYYHKCDYFMFDNKVYSKREYEVVDGKLWDKTLVNEVCCYDRQRNSTYSEKYRLSKKPLAIDALFNKLVRMDTDAVVTVYLDAQSNSHVLANCFKYKDDMLCRGHNSVPFANKWLSTYKICIPIHEISDFKFEIPQEIADGYERLKNNLKDKRDYKSLSRYQVHFDLVTSKSAGKKFKIIKSVFEKIGYTRTTNINATFKMIKDIMEVNL